MALAQSHVHPIPSLPDNVTRSVARTGWLEDWRLATLLLIVAAAVVAGWVVMAIRGRRAGRRPRHAVLRRLGLGTLVGVSTLAGAGIAVNSYAGYAPDVSTVIRAVPALVGARSVAGTPDTSALASAGPYRPRLVALTLSDAAERIPPGRAWVYLPAGYDDPANARHRYPVVYLVHGWPGGSYDWFGAARGPRTAALLQRQGLIGSLIMVAPDASGGTIHDTECLDSTRGGPRLETFLTQTVVAAVDHRFRTVADRSGRAIGGASSGGYCALNLGLRHQSEFGVILGIMPYADPGRNAIRSMLAGNLALAWANSPSKYAGTIPLRYPQAVYLSSGRDDHETYRTAEELARVLSVRGVFVGMRVSPGLGHTWREVRSEFPYALVFAWAHFGKAGPAPTAVPPQPGAEAVSQTVRPRTGIHIHAKW